MPLLHRRLYRPTCLRSNYLNLRALETYPIKSRQSLLNSISPASNLRRSLWSVLPISSTSCGPTVGAADTGSGCSQVVRCSTAIGMFLFNRGIVHVCANPIFANHTNQGVIANDLSFTTQALTINLRRQTLASPDFSVCFVTRHKRTTGTVGPKEG